MSMDIILRARKTNMEYTIPCKQEMGKIYMALDSVTRFLAKWLDDNLKKLSSNYWHPYVVSLLCEQQKKAVEEKGAKSLYDLDLPTILSVFINNRKHLVRNFGMRSQLFSYAHDVKEIRNKYFHKTAKPVAERVFNHDLETISLFLEGLGAPSEIMIETRDELKKESKLALNIPFQQGGQMVDSVISRQSVNSTEVKKVAIPSTDMIGEMDSADVKKLHKPILDRLEKGYEIRGVDVSAIDKASAEELWHEANVSDDKVGLGSPCSAIVVMLNEDSSHTLDEVKSVLEKDFEDFEELPNATMLDNRKMLVWFFRDPPAKEVSGENVGFLPPPKDVEPAIPDWFRRAIGENDLPSLSTREVQMTMGLSPENVLRYAKTYAPRTFLAGVHLGKRLPSEFINRISSAGTMSMIDVGCGTGAMALGMLHGLDRNKAMEKECIPNLTLIDGNSAMLKMSREFFRLRQASHKYSFISCVNCTEVNKEMKSAGDCFPESGQYDIIVTSKFLGEMIARGFRNIFPAFLREAVKHLKIGGVLLLVEILKHQKELCNVVENCLRIM